MKPTLFAIAVFAVPLGAYAQLDKTEKLVTRSKAILDVLVVVVFAIALLVFAWGIVKYLTAAGDAAKLKVARPFLFWGLVGMFVLAALWGLIRFIAGELDIDSPETQGTIKPLKIEP